MTEHTSTSSILKYRVSLSPLAEFVSLIRALNLRLGLKVLWDVVLITNAPSWPMVPVVVKLEMKV